MEKYRDILLVFREARRLAKKIKNESIESDIKIAVLGSTSIQHFVMVLRYILFEEGIIAEIYESEYDGIEMNILNAKSDIYSFAPDYIIILTHYMDIKEFPAALASEKLVCDYVEKKVSHYVNMWKILSRNLNNCKIIQSNFVIPMERVYGSLERKLYFSKHNFYKKINEELEKNILGNVQIVDLDYISNIVGKKNWFDYSAFFISKIGFNLDFLVDVVWNFVDSIKVTQGNVKKCLILDLDNTLWGGVVGDVGYDGIMLDPNNAIGEAYRYFQKYILELKKRGVILAVCSKNDEKLAKEPFEKNENMILKLEDISCFVANWEDKVKNIKYIAKTLNISTDSMVFFDDNPAERDIVSNNLREVRVIEVPEDPALYVSSLDLTMAFNVNELTKEDISRNATYEADFKRDELEAECVDYDAYLQALDMRAEIKYLDENNIDRFVQLINKSNQFNLRTIRYTKKDIETYMKDKEYVCLYGKMMDKFSEYGIISCVILKKNGVECFVDTWVMSCRVLKRDMEFAMFNKIVEIANEMGCEYVTGEYIPTEKNSLVSALYEDLGFEVYNESDKVKKYMCKSIKKLDKIIRIEMC